jgi:glucokinase
MYTGIATIEAFMPRGDEEHILVFDVGGSHIAVAVFNLGDLSVRHFHELSVSSGGSPETFFETFELLSKKALPQGTSPNGVAIAIPNPFDCESGISSMKHKFQHLYGIDLRQGLCRRLRCAPEQIHFLNDAAAFLIGEIHRGAAVDVDRVVGITLGTGVGSAFAVQGEIVVSGRGVPPGGEIWNLPYDTATVENFLSSFAIQRLYEHETGVRAEVREIASSHAKQPEARLTFERFGKSLGETLRHTCLTFNPQRIILGGGISRAAALFLPVAQKELVDLGIQLRVAELGDHAALLGAGVSWLAKPRRMSSQRQPTSAAEEA